MTHRCWEALRRWTQANGHGASSAAQINKVTAASQALGNGAFFRRVVVLSKALARWNWGGKVAGTKICPNLRIQRNNKMSAGSFKLNLVRSSGSKIKSREWGEKLRCRWSGKKKSHWFISLKRKNQKTTECESGAFAPENNSCWRNGGSVGGY